MYIPGFGAFDELHLQTLVLDDLRDRPDRVFVNLRLRDSRIGRAWIALREDEVAAVSMGIPLVRTKMLAYAAGAAFGGVAGVFLGSYATRSTPTSSSSRSRSSSWR